MSRLEIMVLVSKRWPERIPDLSFIETHCSPLINRDKIGRCNYEHLRSHKPACKGGRAVCRVKWMEPGMVAISRLYGGTELATGESWEECWEKLQSVV